MLRLLLILVALTFALPVHANDAWSTCGQSDDQGTNPSLKPDGCLEFAYTSASSAAQPFRVRGPYGTVKFDPDVAKVASDATVVAEVMIQECLRGYAQSDNTCWNMLDATLDGTEGKSSTQRTSFRLPEGRYRLELTVVISGAETASFQVHGENN